MTERQPSQTTQPLDPWDALSLDNAGTDEQAQAARLQLIRRFKECFGTENGQWVLQYLTTKYMDINGVDEHAKNPLVVAGLRDGSRRVIRDIHRLMSAEI